jgi:hypothetical protein
MNKDNGKKIILDLCGGTGAWSKPYKEAGYDVRVITLPEFDVLRTEFIGTAQGNGYMWFIGNCGPMPIYYEEVYGILAAPPCTEFSQVKNEKLPRDIEGALKIVTACKKIINRCNPVFWALENPAGRLKDFIGIPSFVFQPWEFSDAWTKKTHIWGVFNRPVKICKKYEDAPQLNLYKRPGRNKVNFVWLHKSAIKNIPQLAGYNPKTDADFRAITPPGFAKAFYEANP